MGYFAHHFRREDYNISFMHVQPHDYRVGQVEPWHRLGEESRGSFWAIEFLAPFLNNRNNYGNESLIQFTTWITENSVFIPSTNTVIVTDGSNEFGVQFTSRIAFVQLK